MTTSVVMTTRREVKKTVNLTGADVENILREHFRMPNAEIEFDFGYECVRAVTMVEKTVEETTEDDLYG